MLPYTKKDRYIFIYLFIFLSNFQKSDANIYKSEKSRVGIYCDVRMTKKENVISFRYKITSSQK